MHRGIHEEEKYRNIIKNADYVKTISNHYFKACYQIRNEFMVDRSNRVIAVYNGMPSGTKNTVDYAKKIGIEVINVLNDMLKNKK